VLSMTTPLGLKGMAMHKEIRLCVLFEMLLSLLISAINLLLPLTMRRERAH
jgi:hypothetical protein